MSDLNLTDVIAPKPDATPPATGSTGQGDAPVVSTPTPITPASAPATEQLTPQEQFGGFASKEELVKSYDELRAWNTRLAQENAGYKRPEVAKPTPQDVINRFVQNPEEVLNSVRESAVTEAMNRVNETLAFSQIIDNAKAQHPDIVTSKNEPILSSFARSASVPSHITNPLEAAQYRMKYAVEQFQTFVSEIKGSGIKQGEDAAALKAKAGFESGGVQVTNKPGLNKEVVMKLQRENPAEYERLWRSNPQAMLAAFKS